ncbi:MAG: NAD(P)/FAD-dependent oxidoreductase [Actinomycetota bacterium]|nr:NAD(P)/FAD-dependent oxidoreductase [Actinomycetota bacterium]
MLETRVLIAGGGPAGASCGRFLAREGIDSIILEKNLEGEKPCGGGIPSGAFTELGLPQSLISRKITMMRVHPPASASFDIQFPSGYIGIVNRKNFDHGLREMARAEGAQLLAGAFVRFIHKEKGKIVSEVRTADGDEKTLKIRSEYVIAADGVNSRVRAALGLKPVRSLYTLGTKVNLETDACEFFFGGAAVNGYSWIFPSAGLSSVGIGSTDAKILKPALEQMMANLGAGMDGLRLRGYRIPLWEAEPMRMANILFTGDSAGAVMPFTFEGIYYAMRSGTFAAEAIKAGKPGDYPKYWKSRFRLRFMLMKSLWGLFLKNDADTARLLNVFRNKVVQQRGIRLWLEKSDRKGSLYSFINALRKQITF